MGATRITAALAALSAAAACVGGAGAQTGEGRIAFVRFTAESGHPRIFTTAPGGGRPALLPLPVAAAQAPAWSPDGKKLVFVAGENRPGERDITVAADLYVAAADGSRMRRLTRASAPEGGAAWSPDGKRIVFVRSGSSGNRSSLWVAAVPGGRAKRITSGYIDVEPSWSRRGWIAFLRIDPAGYQGSIWIVRPDGTGPRKVLGDRKNVTNPVWAPDGSRLLVQDGRSLVTVGLDGRDPRTVVTLSLDARGTLADPKPTWSPDGRWIAYSQLRPGPRGGADIWVVGADGTSPRRATRSPGFDTDPSWGG